MVIDLLSFLKFLLCYILPLPHIPFFLPPTPDAGSQQEFEGLEREIGMTATAGDLHVLGDTSARHVCAKITSESH